MKLIRALRLLVSTSVRIAPASSIGCLAETAGVIVSLLNSWMLAVLVAAAARGDVDRMILAAVVLVGQIAVSRVLFLVGMNARMNQLEIVGQEFAGRIAYITATLPTLEPLDDPKYLDQLHILKEQQGALGMAVNTLLNQLNSLVGVICVLTLATAADPRMLFVAAASLPTVLAGPVVARWQARTEAASAEPGRLAQALLGLGIAPAHAGEFRVFGLAGPLRARQAAASRAWRAPMLGLAIKESTLTAATQVVFFGAAAVVIGWMVHDALAGTVGIAAITLSILLVTRLQNVSSEMRAIIGQAASMSRTAGRYLWLVELADRLAVDRPTELTPSGSGLRLSGVCYRYPGADHDAVRSVSLELTPGTVLAVVGENGAGKSTLAELIAGIRTPTSGRVVCAGIDQAAVDPSAWRQQVSAAFQDHVRFEFLVSETVGIGDLPASADSDLVLQAVRAGAAEGVVAAVPRGLDTQLGSAWPDGVDLSGGQWQRLAIARSMMRRTPLVRVLDEPTAALDALTEHQLFDRYAEAARTGRVSGTITILVTHRFSTVAAADLVIVLDHGRIVEQGAHDQLIAANGRYAELYNLQARGYRPTTEPEETIS
ncbi:ABC transporter permease [Microlunatus endophyticus]|uniref:ABC transporter permease n=1 Tax=Microlunatus endophyticus TaxID=1716077 RepID=A0A917S1D4_9ACTN|nr:ABC transporter ATP-binding protein [Microlunatus endophyticus]GGL50318.1 ABC transporter permease [Microlunatus endophyticus]